MLQQEQTGIFGKLPAHGDFLHRNLPSRVINVWDEWLQAFVANTQERLGESWLEIYLTSPIWRYCLSQGVVDDNQWAGIVLPSVDRVGRYFPFSIMRKISNGLAPSEFVETGVQWYEEIENLALQALDGQLQIDALLDALNQLSPPGGSQYIRQPAGPAEAGVVVDFDYEQGQILNTMPHLLDLFIKTTFNCYSVWQTAGSDRVMPCVFVIPGMPPVSGGAAMLDGLWEHWEWSVPVRLAE